jgi:hypothetical protein
MTKHTTVVASLLSHLSRSGFEKAVKDYQADKGVRTLPSALRPATGRHTEKPWGR